jgi:enoyl-CoA hydratase/carnithine racemase
MGAVDKVLPHDQLLPEAKKMASQIASMPSGAIQKAKELLRHGMQSTLEQVIQYESMAFLDRMKTDEHRVALNKLLSQMKLTKKRSSSTGK